MKGERITDKALLRHIAWDDADGYRVIEEATVDKQRWQETVKVIFKRLSDDKLFVTYWWRGLTENCDHDYPDIAQEVVAKTETITVTRYEKVE